jgi:hypothetical protein
MHACLPAPAHQQRKQLLRPRLPGWCEADIEAVDDCHTALWHSNLDQLNTNAADLLPAKAGPFDSECVSSRHLRKRNEPWSSRCLEHLIIIIINPCKPYHFGIGTAPHPLAWNTLRRFKSCLHHRCCCRSKSLAARLITRTPRCPASKRLHMLIAALPLLLQAPHAAAFRLTVEASAAAALATALATAVVSPSAHTLRTSSSCRCCSPAAAAVSSSADCCERHHRQQQH